MKRRAPSKIPAGDLWSLTGKKFLVTGGSRGIGFAVCSQLLDQGASVLFCGQREDEVTKQLQVLHTNEGHCASERSEERNVYGISCDISTSSGREILIQKAKEVFGDSFDGLINNVGWNFRATIEEAKVDDYYKMFATNVDSAYFLCKGLQDMLADQEEGAIVVNVASAAGLFSSGTGAIYGMTKGAIITLTKCLACEWAKYNIRVNAVAPWMTYTPMLKEAVQANPKALDKVKEWTPMGRLSDPSEIAAPILFLCMSASSYITGQCIAIDGGLTAQGYDGPCVTPDT